MATNDKFLEKIDKSNNVFLKLISKVSSINNNDEDENLEKSILIQLKVYNQ